MRRGLLAMVLAACITDGEVSAALSEYCAVNDGKPCEATSQCCDGFACAQGICQRITAGKCLLPADAGRQQGKGEGCGCANDCATGACTDSKCP